MTDYYRVTNETKGTTLAERSQKATNWARRGVGLIGRKGLPPGGGLIIEPSNAIVTFFMRFPIDVLFVSRENQVCEILRAIPPWRASKMVRAARLVVELPAGTVDSTQTEAGDRLRIERV